MERTVPIMFYNLAPTDSDTVMNGDETDVDCGGTSTNKCAYNKKCIVTGDCNKASCLNSVCAGKCSHVVKTIFHMGNLCSLH